MRQSWHSSPCPRRRGARSSITRGHSPDRCVCARESAGAGAIGEDLHRAGGPVGQRERPSSRKCEEARRSTDPPFAPPGVRITAPSNDEGSPIRQRLWSCPARMGRRLSLPALFVPHPVPALGGYGEPAASRGDGRKSSGCGRGAAGHTVEGRGCGSSGSGGLRQSRSCRARAGRIRVARGSVRGRLMRRPARRSWKHPY